MRKLVIINPRARKASNAVQLQQLTEALRALPDTEIHLLRRGDSATQLARARAEAGAEVVAAAGGDGTLSAVANGLAGSETAFAAMPLGTLNNFARNLGLSSEPEACARLLLAEQCVEQRIDLGSVNGHYFINNSSLGLYPRLVRLRERHQKALGKWPAYGLALLQVLRRPVTFGLEVHVDSGDQRGRAGLLFVSNNRTVTPVPGLASRPRLDEGLLDLYLVRAAHLTGLLRVAAAFLRGSLDDSPLAEHILTDHAVVYTHLGGPHAVAADGEVLWLRPPLRYEIARQALKIRLPAAT